jgi:hypothetical protein
MQSIGSLKGGFLSVRQGPGSALPFLDSRRSLSDHCETVSDCRGAKAFARTVLIICRAFGGLDDMLFSLNKSYLMKKVVTKL